MYHWFVVLFVAKAGRAEARLHAQRASAANTHARSRTSVMNVTNVMNVMNVMNVTIVTTVTRDGRAIVTQPYLETGSLASLRLSAFARNKNVMGVTIEAV